MSHYGMLPIGVYQFKLDDQLIDAIKLLVFTPRNLLQII